MSDVSVLKANALAAQINLNSIANKPGVTSAEIVAAQQAAESAQGELNTTIRAGQSQSGGTLGDSNTVPPPPAVSAGASAIMDSVARQNSLIQNPPPPPTTEAKQAALQNVNDQGTNTTSTNASLNQTSSAAGQGIGAQGTTSSANGSVDQARVNASAVAGQVNNTVPDDRSNPTSVTGNSTYANGKVIIPNAFIQEAETKGNSLDGFASMTYNIALYLMSPDDYKQMVATGKKNLLGSQLLIQSGGIDSKNRSEFFDVDFYIDNLEIKSAVSGTSVQSAHNTLDLSFTVIEPNGISFIPRLKAAVDKQLNPDAGQTINYASIQYLLVIRFYGYDQAGNLISKTTSNDTNTSDPNSLIEKFIPFIMTENKFRIQNKLVEYRVKGACPNTSIGFSQGTATIPFNLELTGATLKEILLGSSDLTTNQVLAEAQAGPNSGSSSGPASSTSKITRGLIDAMNKLEQVRAKQNGMIANIYDIQFVTGFNIETATLVQLGDLDMSKRPGSDSADPASKNPKKGSVDTSRRNYSIAAGTQIVQALDTLIQRSSYIRDQQIFVTDESGNNQLSSPTQAPVTQWYKIRSFIQPLNYDYVRNDYAYKITYVIGPYKISNAPGSPYFPASVVRNPQKKYSYWFTGANGGTDSDGVANGGILELEQDYNYLYYQIMTGVPYATNITTTGTENVRRVPMANSTESKQGNKKQVNEAAASLASSLYSPGDQGQITMKIIGDPDYIQQGEVFYNTQADITGSSAVDVYLPDGSINYDSREVLFDVVFLAPTDYDYSTGVLSKDSFSSSNLGTGSKTAKGDFRYRANIVTSHFQRGAFTQTIEGSLMISAQQSDMNSGDPAVASSPATQADVRAVDNAIAAPTTDSGARTTTTPVTGSVDSVTKSAVNGATPSPVTKVKTNFVDNKNADSGAPANYNTGAVTFTASGQYRDNTPISDPISNGQDVAPGLRISAVDVTGLNGAVNTSVKPGPGTVMDA